MWPFTKNEEPKEAFATLSDMRRLLDARETQIRVEAVKVARRVAFEALDAVGYGKKPEPCPVIVTTPPCHDAVVVCDPLAYRRATAEPSWDTMAVSGDSVIGSRWTYPPAWVVRGDDPMRRYLEGNRARNVRARAEEARAIRDDARRVSFRMPDIGPLSAARQMLDAVTKAMGIDRGEAWSAMIRGKTIVCRPAQFGLLAAYRAERRERWPNEQPWAMNVRRGSVVIVSGSVPLDVSRNPLP